MDPKIREMIYSDTVFTQNNHDQVSGAVLERISSLPRSISPLSSQPNAQKLKIKKKLKAVRPKAQKWEDYFRQTGLFNTNNIKKLGGMV